MIIRCKKHFTADGVIATFNYFICKEFSSSGQRFFKRSKINLRGCKMIIGNEKQNSKTQIPFILKPFVKLYKSLVSAMTKQDI